MTQVSYGVEKGNHLPSEDLDSLVYAPSVTLSKERRSLRLRLRHLGGMDGEPGMIAHI